MHSLTQALEHRRALKIISGLNNFDRPHVKMVVEAASAGGATFVDIAADADLIEMVAGLTNLPICVSAVEVDKLEMAIAHGADLVEIGNFDSFYAQGIVFSATEVMELTQATRRRLPDVTLSVTVPHILPLDQQVELAQALANAGADIIQTEGGTSAQPHSPGVLGLIEKAAPTLAAAHAISRAVDIPVLCASGLSDVTAPMAIAAGAAGVGVGSAVNRLEDQLGMIAVVKGLAQSIKSAATVKSL